MEEIYKPINTFTYRDITLDIYYDDPSQSLFTIIPWENKIISFGSCNASYKEEAEFLIDEHLDVITRDFGDEFFGACLKWFDNAGYRDIQLTYKQRLLKIFLVRFPGEVNTEKLIKESKEILAKIRN